MSVFMARKPRLDRPGCLHHGAFAAAGVYSGQENGMDGQPAQKTPTLQNPAVLYYAWDHLGTIRLITNDDASLVERHDYEPYGLELPPYVNQSANTHQFTGHERDLTSGFDYMHFRYFGSTMGRFCKPDNIAGNLANPQSWNRYSYVVGNPVNFNDPTGHWWNSGSVGSDDSQHPGAYPDNGETPLSSSGLLPAEMRGTIGTAEPLSWTFKRFESLGFSESAIRKALTTHTQANLAPTIKAYIVKGGVGHAAISASLGGETIWWSHGGMHNWHWKGAINNKTGKYEDYSEIKFIDDYLKHGDSVWVYTLDISPEQAIGVVNAIKKRLDFMNHGNAFPKTEYAYNEITYNCSQSVMDILSDAGLITAKIKGFPFPTLSNMSPYQIKTYLQYITKDEEDYLEPK